MSVQEIVRRASGITVRCCIAVILALCVISPSLAQEYIGPADDPYYPPVKRSSAPPPLTTSEKSGGSTDSVIIETLDPSLFPQICSYVTVLHDGSTVPGLTPDSFCVSQDGVPIDSFTVVQQTLDSCATRICLVIDRSGSMGSGANSKMTAAKNAALALMRQMDQYDLMAIVSFANCYTVNVGFTNDTVAIKNAINGLSASGWTAALDGIWAGVDLTKLLTGSKAVIALSDGMENYSQNCSAPPDGLSDPQGFSDDSTIIVSLAKTSAVPIYTISLGTDFEPDYLQGLANGSGGAYYHAPTGAQLEGIYTAIKERLCRRYLICYTSPDTILNGDCHTVVICRDNNDNDKTGGKPDCFVCDTAVYCEPFPPTISIDVDPACRRWGQDVDLCATVTDSDTPPESLTVKLFYRIFEPGGSFLEVTPSRNGNLFCHKIPAAFLPCGRDSVEFYFTATDGISAVASPPTAPLASHQVTICQNSPPTCEFGPDLAPPVCNPNSPIDFVPLNLTDIDGNKSHCTLYGDGQIVGGGWQNDSPTPGDTAYAYIVCFDSCGDSCFIEIERVYPERQLIPCNLPDGGDTSLFACDPGLISIPVSGGEGSSCTLLEGAGALVNGNWEYNATKDTTITFVIQCIGICDSCYSSYTVAIDINEPPICGLPGERSGPKGGELCDSVNMSDHFTLEFMSVSYSGNNSTWCYELTWDGTPPGLSHLTFELCDSLTNANLVGSSPAGAKIELDGSTGLYGLKWDSGVLPHIPADTAVQFCFTLNRPLALAQSSFVPKAGQNQDIVDICGPSTNCAEDPGTGPKACDTTVFLCDPGPVCVPYSAFDPDGNLELCRIVSGPGALVNGSWCFDALEDGTYYVTIECVDSCGETCQQELCATVVIDKVPVITCPDDTTFECGDVGDYGTPTVVDGGYAPATLATLIDSIPGNCAGTYTLRIRYIASDSCGHADTCFQNVVVGDTTPPVIACPDSLIFECPIVPTLNPPIATDICDSDVEVVASRYRVEDSTCLGSYRWVITWVATDACGNQHSCDQVIRFRDTTPPQFDSCDPLYFSCDSVPAEFFAPTATDNCDSELSYNLLGVSDTTIGDCPQRYSFTLYWEATDDCGNADTCNQVVYVTDTTKPVVTCPPDTTIDCHDVGDGKINEIIQGLIFWPFGNATATDNCDTMPSISAFQVTQLGELPCSYVIEIGYYATDACGNVSDTCYRAVTIQDTTKPILGACVPLVTIACDSFYNKDAQSGLLPVLPTATDNCDDDPEIRWQYIGSGGTWPCNYYDSIAIWAVDTCGNSSDTCYQRVELIDTTAPVIECPVSSTVPCSQIPTFWVPPQATDNCSVPQVAQLGEARWGYADCPAPDTIVITWVATDGCGLADTCEQIVLVVDDTPPVLTCTDLRYHCDSVPDEWPTPSAIDNCDQSPVVTLIDTVATDPGDPECPQNYRLTLRWQAIDACGNADTCEQYVSVFDIVRPEIVCPENQEFECDVDTTLFAWPRATDNCDAEPTIELVVYDRSPIGGTCGYVLRRGWHAVDDCGNYSDTCYQSITVGDTTRPTVTCPKDTVIACQDIPPTALQNLTNASSKVPIGNYPFGDPSAEDNCDQSPDIFWFIESQSGTFPCDKQFVIGYWALDECGNASDTCFQDVSIVDTIAPVIECPVSSTVPCSQIPTFWVPPQATDNCSVPQVAQLGEARWGYADCPAPDTIVITWVATDRCGLADTCEQIVLVVDDTPPVLTCTDLRYHCDSVPAEWPTPSAIDNCDPTPVVTLLDTLANEPGTPLCPQNYRLTLRWVATDECGNADTCQQFVSVFDIVRPEIVCPENQEFECDVDTTLFAWPTATDNCDGEPTIELVAYEKSPIGQTCGYVLRRGWHAVDDCGNYSDTCYQSITVGDTTRPTVTCPKDTVIACQDIPPTALQNLTNASSKVPIGNYPFGDPSAEDNCDQSPDIFWFIESQSGTFPCDKQFVIGYWALDECGNASDTCFQDVSIVDTIAPVVVCAPDTTVYCDDNLACLKTKAGRGRLSDEKGLCGFRIVDTVYDNCQDVLDPWFDVFIQDTECPQYVRVKVWAVDQCGQISDTCTWTAYILDTLAPVITCPDDIFIECGDAPTDWGMATATDNCSTPRVALVDVDTVATQGECYIEIKRTFVATDFCGLADTCVQTIVVGDSTAPVIVCPPDTTIDCEDLVGIDDPRTTFKAWAAKSPKVSGECFPTEWLSGLLRLPSATDNCSENPRICLFAIKVVSEDPCELVVDLSYYAIDDCGNADTCTQRVRIVDETRPVIVCAPDTTILCDRNKAACIDLKGTDPFKLDDNKFLCGFRMIDSVYDACCDEVEVFSFLTYRLNQCPAYIKAFIWAVDCCGNVSDTCEWILYFDDPTPPEIVCPGDLTYNCDEVQGDWGWPTATDNCDNVVNVTLFDQDTVTEGCETVITRTFLAKDRCNNESRCQQVITISDTTDPVCVVPNDTTIFLCEPGEQVCLPVSATDNCDQSPTCIVADGAGEIVNGQWCYTPTEAGPVTAYIRCSDDCGNECNSSFTVTFAINRAPICYLGEDSTVYLCDPGDITISAAASDPDSNLVGLVLGPVAGPGGKSGAGWDSVEVSISFLVERDTVICYVVRAVDACGEECVDTICITVEITEPPVCYKTPDTTVVLCNPEEVCIQTDFLETLRTSGSDVVRPTRNSKGQIVYPRQPQQPVAPVTKSLTEGCELMSNVGELKNGYWCWTPPDYDTVVTVSIRCADTCGHFCSNEFTVTFDMNVNPTCSIFVELVDPICTPEVDFVPLGSFDVDGETECRLVEGPGELAQGGWRFEDPVPGTSVDIVIVCSDTCGDSCVIEFTRNYPQLIPVECRVPGNIDTTLCQPATLSFPVSGGANSTCRVTAGPGSVVDGNWTYYGEKDTSFCVTIQCLSLCDSCETTFCVDINMNEPPVCDLPNDTTIFLCEPGTVCLPIGATDADGNFMRCDFNDGKSGSPWGYIANGMWCYDVQGDGEITVPIVCLDSCFAGCTGEFTVTFVVNDPPVCNDIRDTSLFLCSPGEQICIPVGASDPNVGQNVTCAVQSGQGVVSNGFWCFTPQNAGVYNVTIRCTDDCGDYCDESFAVTVDFNEPPVCSGPPADTTVFLCQPSTVCFDFSATDADGNLAECIIVEDDKGTPSGGGAGVQWCDFISVDQFVTITAECRDSCGAVCQRVVNVQFVMNRPPVINLGDDIATLLGAGQVCFNYTVSDPDGMAGLNEALITAPAGAVIDTAANTICWTPDDAGTFTFIGRVRDGCNATDFDTALVFVAQPQPPVCNLPNDTTVVMCTFSQIQLPVSATSLNPPVTCQVIAGPGTVSGGFWRFTPSAAGTYDVTIRCTDNLNATCEGSFRVTVQLSQPPMCNVRDTSIFLCDPGPICIPVSGIDPEGGAVTCTKISGPGTLSNGQWCFNATKDTSFNVTFQCSDPCGQTCQKTVNITINMNESPHCSFPFSQTIFICQGDMICLELQGSDADGNLAICGIKDGLGEVLPNGPNGSYVWCYTPTGQGIIPVTVFCADACGDSCIVPRQFSVIFNPPGSCGGSGSQVIQIGAAAAVLGDVNGSGDVNVADIATLTALVHQLNAKGRTGALDVRTAAAGYQYQADLNCDGKIDFADVALLTAYIFSAGPAPCDPNE